MLLLRSNFVSSLLLWVALALSLSLRRCSGLDRLLFVAVRRLDVSVVVVEASAESMCCRLVGGCASRFRPGTGFVLFLFVFVYML